MFNHSSYQKTPVPDSFVKSTYFVFFQSIICYVVITAISLIFLFTEESLENCYWFRKIDHCKPLFIAYGSVIFVNLYMCHVLIYYKK